MQKDGFTSSVGGGGGNVTKLNKKVEELSTRLMEKTEQVSEAHLGKAEVSSALVQQRI